MLAFFIRRVGQSLFVIITMATLVFFGVNVVGDPVAMLVAPDADQAEIERVIRDFGLDKPIIQQFGLFLKGLTRGDFGNSFIFGEPAIELILDRLPATLELAIGALLLSIVIGLPLGLVAGLFPDHWGSKTIMALSIFGFSLPTFWVGILLIMTFSVSLGWLPSTGRGDTVSVLGLETSLFTLDGLTHLALPALNLALLKISLVIRLTRASVRETMQQDYIKFARAKGLSEFRIVRVHVLKLVLIPIVTVLGLEFGNLIAFSVVTESIFAWPGMGKLLIEAVLQLDRPIIVAYLMLIVVVFVTINLIVDLTYTALDPRVRLGGEKA